MTVSRVTTAMLTRTATPDVTRSVAVLKKLTQVEFRALATNAPAPSTPGRGGRDMRVQCNGGGHSRAGDDTTSFLPRTPGPGLPAEHDSLPTARYLDRDSHGTPWVHG